MKKTIWTTQFLGSTRGRILEALCYTPQTVPELAGKFRLTKNAVRAHLAALVRDGLVEQTGQRRGARRPYAVYDLTADGHRLFPKGYEAVAVQLLDVLLKRLRPRRTRALLREVGRGLIKKHLPGMRSLTLARRIERLVELLSPTEETRRAGSKLWIRGCGCPLASMVRSYPELCDIAALLLSDTLGTQVRRRCTRGALPRCCFEVETAAAR